MGRSLFSNFRSHIRDSKWGRKCNFINCTSSNREPQEIPFQFANGKLPHSRCRAFWAIYRALLSTVCFKMKFYIRYFLFDHGGHYETWMRTWLLCQDTSHKHYYPQVLRPGFPLEFSLDGSE